MARATVTIEIPESCCACPFLTSGYDCHLTDVFVGHCEYRRHEGCPLCPLAEAPDA